MFINTKKAISATLLLFSLGRLSLAVGSDPLVARLLSSDPGLQAQALKELDGLNANQKSLIVIELTRGLRSDAASAERAAHALTHMAANAEPAIPALVGALQYDEETVYTAVSETLLTLGSPSVTPLRKVLSDNNFFVRRRAIEILGKFGVRAQSAAPQLVMLLQDPEVQVHQAAAQALLQMSAAGVSALTAEIPKEEESNRKFLVSMLGHFGATAAPALIRVLRKDESAFVRGAAAEALGQIHEVPSDALLALMTATHDLDEGLRSSAIDALGQIGPNASLALGNLMMTAHADRDPLVRDKAHQAVLSIGNGNKDSLPGFMQGMKQDNVEVKLEILETVSQSSLSLADALPVITASQKDASPAVRIKGIAAISKLQKQSSEGLELLAAAMNDPQLDVRTAAVHELGLMKQSAPAAASALRTGLQDSNPALREQSISALTNLGTAGIPLLLQELKDPYTVLSDQAAKSILKQGNEAVPALEAAAAGADTVLSKKADELLKRLRQKRPHKPS
jgi:HEAT repeat protein